MLIREREWEAVLPRTNVKYDCNTYWNSPLIVSPNSNTKSYVFNGRKGKKKFFKKSCTIGDENFTVRTYLGLNVAMSTSTHRSLCLNLLAYFEATLFDKVYMVHCCTHEYEVKIDHYCKNCTSTWISPVPGFCRRLSNSVYSWLVVDIYTSLNIRKDNYRYSYHLCICTCDIKEKKFSLFPSILSGILPV